MNGLRLLSLLGVLNMPSISFGQDLISVYREALQSSPQLEKAREGLEAMLEGHSQANANAFLPEANLSANVSRDFQNVIVSGAAVGEGGYSAFNSSFYTLSVTQPILHYDRWIALDQADIRIAKAEADNTSAEIALMLKVSERYFDVLAAEENVNFTKAQKQSLERRLNETRQRQKAGFLALTDVQEAQSGYDRSLADALYAEHQWRDAKEGLREITNSEPEQLNFLETDIPLIVPEPANEKTWVDLALTQNIGLLAIQKTVEVAQNEIKRLTAGHYPTMDAVGSHVYTTTGGRFGTADIEDNIVGLNLNLPIYQGGQVSSKVREAEHKYRQSLADLDEQKRAVQRLTSKSYLGVVAGISRVKALKQALLSSETGLKATLAGFNAGRRTALDVIVAERDLLSAQKDLAKARYDYLLDTLRLKQAVGSLSPQDLQKINTWLVAKLPSK